MSMLVLFLPLAILSLEVYRAHNSGAGKFKSIMPASGKGPRVASPHNESQKGKTAHARWSHLTYSLMTALIET